MKTRAVWVLTSLLLVLSMTLAGTMTFADDGAVPRGRLTSEIDYRFVGHLEQLDDEGKLLVWKGIIEGDFTGEMKWWFVQSCHDCQISLLVNEEESIYGR